MDFKDEITRKKQAQRDKAEKDFALAKTVSSIKDSSQNIVKAVQANKDTGAVKQAVDSGSKLVSSAVEDSKDAIISSIAENQQSVSEALNNLVVATVISKDPRLLEVSTDLAKLLNELAEAKGAFEKAGINQLPIANKTLANAITKLTSSIKSQPDRDYRGDFEKLGKIFKGLNVKPVINVPEASVEVDLSPLLKTLLEVKQAVEANKIEIPSIDNGDVIEAVNDVASTIKNLRFPIPNYILPFLDPTTGKATQVVLTSDGKLPVSSTPTQSSSPTVTSVDDSASSVTLIAANSSRKEVEFFNLSSANLYIRKGTTAATTSSGGFTIRLTQYGYYRTDYTGAFRGIWDADAGGAVSITEST